jgi:hypothetical protein
VCSSVEIEKLDDGTSKSIACVPQPAQAYQIVVVLLQTKA